jgi:protein gp37
MHPDWARSIRDQCVAANVPFFFKQWGNFLPLGCAELNSTDYDERAVLAANIERTVRVWPDGKVDDGNALKPEGRAWFMEPVGKKAAGHLLDGREWREMPEDLRVREVP